MPTPEDLKQMQQELRKRQALQADEVPDLLAPKPHAALEARQALEQLRKINEQPDFILKRGRILRATEHSAAFDLFYAGEKDFVIGDRPVAIPTGVYTEFRPGLVAVIKEKSGLALKGLEVKGGVIDADYRDEWKVIARFPEWIGNYEIDELGKIIPDTYTVSRMSGWKPFVLKPGDKVAQFMLVSLPRLRLSEEAGTCIELSTQVREGGFGSTDSKAKQ